MNIELFCQETGKIYEAEDRRWRSESGAPLDIRFVPEINLDQVKARPPTMWRYREALPIAEDRHIVSVHEGFTPLVPYEIEGKRLLLKQEQLFPTGSFKDRGASLLISRALELGVDRVVEDSSGNAGAAVAAYAARAGIECDIYVPDATSPAKLAQIERYGARLHKIPGNREKTAEAAREAAEDHFYASHVWNPYFFQGTKTFAFEIWEQLGGRMPDAVILPAGHGTLLIGAFLGFQDLLMLGYIDCLPKLIAVQAANCAPLYRMWRDGLKAVPTIEDSETLAEGIAITRPTRAHQMLEILRATNGEVIVVSESEIENALLQICRQGLYVEPTSATAIAAWMKYPGTEGETVVAPLTGHGLKSTEKMLKLGKTG